MKRTLITRYFTCIAIMLAGCVSALPVLDEATREPQETSIGSAPTQGNADTEDDAQICPIEDLKLVVANELMVGKPVIVKADVPNISDPNTELQFAWSSEKGEFQAGKITTGPSNIYLPLQEGAALVSVSLIVSKDGAEITACRNVEARMALLLSAPPDNASTNITNEPPSISETTTISTGDMTGSVVGGDVSGDVSTTINEAQEFRDKYTLEGETPDSIILLMKQPQSNPLTGVLDIFGNVQESGINNPADLIDAVNELNLTVAGDGFVIASGTEVEIIGESEDILMDTGALDNLPPTIKESLGPFIEGLTMTQVRILEGQYADEEGWVISNLIRKTEAPKTEQ